MRKEDLTEKVINRYLSLVHDTDDCIEWPLSKDKDGYGWDKLYINGKNKTIKAHRTSYLIFHGDIPETLQVCHSCDNPSCINPKHLWLGTCKQNIEDRDRKGHLNITPSWEANIKRSKITQDDVNNMRALYDSGIQQKEIAKVYGVSRTHVCVIVNNKSRVK